MFRLTDENDSGSIDLASEALKVWEPSNIPTGFDFRAGAFSVATGPTEELSITSNGSQPNRPLVEKKEQGTLNWEQGEVIDNLWIRIDLIFYFHAYV
ncbi:MAG: hypothetical protein F6K22_21135 [Okeania sp. SIO2F4]|uniref:hypothetical protein n=1 Tax=Okeania sp. SIO2F4 TaxID=2607790 RepID=UPI001429F55D|nr:hypothetical protein [Okeania sp. SIO2F4]NES05107.1 hypothetical protein [Okeania sp. SIO2F4]